MEVPDGMITVWTIERPDGNGVLIDDLNDNEAEARAEVERRGYPWTSRKLTVPYRRPDGSS